MNKLILALMCMFGSVAAFATDNVITNVYDFKTTLKVPYLKNGERTYPSQILKGYLYVEYTDSEATSMWLNLQNNKTKVIHYMNVSEGFYNLMGKTTKTSARSTPSVYFEAADVENEAVKEEAHEFITKMQFAGTGSLKYIKTVVKGCGSCGEPTKTTNYCNILYKMNGNVTGVMDCQCPDDEDGWWHTVKTVLCGVYFNDDGDVERDHKAATWGTWSATFNAKLSDSKIK